MDLFNTPIQKKKVRNGIFAYKYSNGNINIGGIIYIDYSITEAISRFRKKYPAY
jgi:hypothetical protein